jgi:hypothetical protein
VACSVHDTWAMLFTHHNSHVSTINAAWTAVIMTPADYSCITKAEDLCVLSAFTIHIMYSYHYAPGPACRGSASSASHTRKIAAPVSLRTWWARESMRGRETSAASSSAPNRSRRPDITSISFGAGGGLERDAPPVSPPVLGVGADHLAGTSSIIATSPDAGAAVAGPP